MLHCLFRIRNNQRYNKASQISARNIMAVLQSLTRPAHCFHLSYSIPHRVKCRAEAVNNLSRSLETCNILKIILSQLKFKK